MRSNRDRQKPHDPSLPHHRTNGSWIRRFDELNAYRAARRGTPRVSKKRKGNAKARAGIFDQRHGPCADWRVLSRAMSWSWFLPGRALGPARRGEEATRVVPAIQPRVHPGAKPPPTGAGSDPLPSRPRRRSYTLHPVAEGRLCNQVPARPEDITPHIRLLFIAPPLRMGLPSDPVSRRCPCPSPCLRLCKPGQRTCTDEVTRHA